VPATLLAAIAASRLVIRVIFLSPPFCSRTCHSTLPPAINVLKSSCVVIICTISSFFCFPPASRNLISVPWNAEWAWTTPGWGRVLARLLLVALCVCARARATEGIITTLQSELTVYVFQSVTQPGFATVRNLYTAFKHSYAKGIFSPVRTL
jgi:hypothetical protein